jgi:hypothetical protein
MFVGCDRKGTDDGYAQLKCPEDTRGAATERIANSDVLHSLEEDAGQSGASASVCGPAAVLLRLLPISVESRAGKKKLSR